MPATVQPGGDARGRFVCPSTSLVGLVLLSAFVLAACDEEAGAAGGAPPHMVTDVEVGVVQDGPITVTRRYLGQVLATERAELGAGAAGEVQRVTVHEGDRVERGAVLVQIDPGLAQAAVRSAEAERSRVAEELAQAARDAERFGAAGQQAVSAAEVERSASAARALEAEEARTQAALAHAREELGRHRITAPFAGVVARRLVDPGDWVQTGAPVIELVATGAVEILVRVEPELLTDVEVGVPVTLISRGRRAAGRVEGIVPTLDERTRTAQLRVLATEETPWLRAGATVDVELTLDREGEGLVVPRDALVFGVATTRIFTVHEGTVTAHEVRVVDRGADRVRVVGEGLAVGDRVVTRGNERLRPGQEVRVVGPNADDAEASGDEAQAGPTPEAAAE